LGISNSGLNQSADGDLENFYNIVRQLQQTNIRRPLRKLLRLLYIDLFGKDSAADLLDTEFPSLWNNSEEEEEKIKRMKLDLITEGLQNGLLSPKEAVEELNAARVYRTILDGKDLDVVPEDGDEEEDDGEEDDDNKE
jgi:hypothetical protein